MPINMESQHNTIEVSHYNPNIMVEIKQLLNQDPEKGLFVHDKFVKAFKDFNKILEQNNLIPSKYALYHRIISSSFSPEQITAEDTGHAVLNFSNFIDKWYESENSIDSFIDTCQTSFGTAS